MKIPLPFLILLAHLSFALSYSSAQSTTYITPGGVTIGFGLGASYQQSDLANSRGYGFDFRLGQQFSSMENSILSADWRFRFLKGENRAHDHRINPDNTYSNIRFDFYTYDLEFGLTLNRLRERTRIVLTGFAGVGITHGRTFTDLLNEYGLPYDYGEINPNQKPAQVYSELLKLSDRRYETKLDNRAAIMPTLGIYLGFQFTPAFTMGIEHKTNFSLTESNSVFGMNMDNRILPSSRRDRNHYTTLAFRWTLGGYLWGGYDRPVSPVIVPGPPTPVTSFSEPRPVVRIFDPSSDPYSTASGTYIIRARIQNIRSFHNIRFFQDGVDNENFTFYSSRNNFTANVQLREGVNTFRIVAENSSGSAEDAVTIVVDRPAIRVDLPAVNIIVPSSRPHNTAVNRIDAAARVRNVRGKEDIQVLVNGRDERFDFNRSNGTLSIPVILTEGINNLVVRAVNEAGTASDNVTIIYNPPVVRRPPVVRITVPAGSVTVQRPTFTITAETSNLQRKEDLVFRINGVRTGNFTFNNRGIINADLLLNEGTNLIEISGTNEFGTTSDKVSIFYVRPVTILPPAITILTPGASPLRTYENEEEFRARVSYVRDRENITFSVNGRNTGNFSYDNNTNVLYARVGLNEGSNTIVISAQNEAGHDSKTQIYLKESKPCPLPTLRLIEPSKAQITTEIQNHNIILLATGAKNVSVSYQGRNYGNFRFDPSSGQIVISLSAAPGSNILEVNAVNDCGNTYQRVELIYRAEEPCVAPVINVLSGTGLQTDIAQFQFRAQVSNVKNARQLKLTFNGAIVNFDFSSNTVSFNASLRTGLNTFVFSAQNECGSDSKSATVNYSPIEEPCLKPNVNITVTEVNGTDASHELKGKVTHVKSKSEIILTLNGQADNSFLFVPTTGEISGKFSLQPGTHTIVVRAMTTCGEDARTVTVRVEEPCFSPVVNFTVTEVNRTDANHELKGTVTNVKSKSEITLTVNSQADNSFQFVPTTGEISAEFRLQPGNYIFIVAAKNSCGADSKSQTIKIEEKACGPRINPGNAAWQFCLVTPSGIFNRDNLMKSDFSYSGPASSLYFLPIAGGGDAIVNGKPFSLRPGQYYLFEGNLRVAVSTKNPGSMGHWSVCIESNKEPVSGSGNDRPKSPCETMQETTPGHRRGTQDGNN